MALIGGWQPYLGGLVGNTWTSEDGKSYYWKDRLGLVHCEGLLGKPASNWAPNDPIARFPLGFIPWINQIFVVESRGGGAENSAQVRIYGRRDPQAGLMTIGARGGPANPIEWLSTTQIRFWAGPRT
jgi:hypothetical protein